jgi:selenide,water dikinase
MGVGDDAAILTSPDSSKLTIQTIDYFRSFISDPYLFGKIAANHALSDLHAMNGDPISALALCVLPFGKEDKVENDLVQVNYYYSKICFNTIKTKAHFHLYKSYTNQMIAGACSILKKEGCSLVGGHSSEGLEM